jgi:hypothetical protein
MKKTVFGIITAVTVIAAAGCGSSPSPAAAADTEDPEYILSGGTITGYKGSAKDITVPDRIGRLPVTAIGNSAFTGVRLTSAAMPGSVTAIGRYAFASNQLSSVTIGNSVAAIGAAAFAGNQLAGVTIPHSVKTIGERAFADNQLTSVTIGTNVAIAADAFPGNLAEIYTNANKAAGTYISSDNGKTWSKQ